MKYLLLLLAVLSANTTHAQFNDTVTHYVAFMSTGTYNRTNDYSSYVIDNGLKFSIQKKKITMNSNNKWLYGRQDEQLTNNDFTSTWDINLYLWSRRFYCWGLLNYYSAYSLHVNHQAQAGSGLAYVVTDKKIFYLNISDGFIYEYSDVTLEDGVREVYGTPRNSLRLQIRSNIKDVILFNSSGFLQNSLIDSEDYIIKSELSLAIKIRSWLSLDIGFTYNEISKTATNNMFVTYGFMLEKYF